MPARAGRLSWKRTVVAAELGDPGIVLAEGRGQVEVAASNIGAASSGRPTARRTSPYSALASAAPRCPAALP